MSKELHFGEVESMPEEELLSDWVSSVSLPSTCCAGLSSFGGWTDECS